jgi:hypothetical protein
MPLVVLANQIVVISLSRLDERMNFACMWQVWRYKFRTGCSYLKPDHCPGRVGDGIWAVVLLAHLVYVFAIAD